jgi:hypothetical protein
MRAGPFYFILKRSFCMAETKVMNRWMVVIGAILVQLCLGAIYAWSAFTGKMTAAADLGGVFCFSKTQTQVIFGPCDVCRCNGAHRR